jgi:hypothetical protein
MKNVIFVPVIEPLSFLLPITNVVDSGLLALIFLMVLELLVSDPGRENDNLLVIGEMTAWLVHGGTAVQVMLTRTERPS